MREGNERNPQITHKIMSAIPSKGTKPELLLRKALWKQNFRYRVNYKKLPGKPDIVFTKYHIAVFCDGDFWHGHNWAIRGLSSLAEELEGYSEFWRKKILRNIERDREINSQLHFLGWTVVRFWESEIYADLDGCVKTIQETIFDSKIDMEE
ncbi:MAG: very short patch repair endonuclease [Acetatifactor sp.]|nr:very short patch repair endonuclease [Acetatifactor sp.]